MPRPSPSPATSPTPTLTLTPLTFHGGLAGALAPFAAFLGGVAWLALNGAPDEKGFWPILLGALMLGLLLAKDRERYAEAMLDGMSERVVMVMLCAWLFAGVMGAVLSAGGLVTGLAWASRTVGLGGGAYVAATFLTTAIVSTATGTSFGTILLCGPILYPAGGAAGAMPAALMGAVLAGSTFGDSMSPVSDTTIASSGTQRVDIGGTVRSRLKYAVPAGLVALVASALLGGGGPVTDVIAATTSDTAAASPKGLVLLLSPALVIAMLLRRTHLITALLTGVATAVGIALALQLVTPYDLLHIAPGTFGATGVLVDGMQRAIGVSVFTLLLVALVGTLQATDVLDRLERLGRERALLYLVLVTTGLRKGELASLTVADVVLDDARRGFPTPGSRGDPK